jgi:hypothetical protein
MARIDQQDIKTTLQASVVIMVIMAKYVAYKI